MSARYISCWDPLCFIIWALSIVLNVQGESPKQATSVSLSCFWLSAPYSLQVSRSHIPIKLNGGFNSEDTSLSPFPQPLHPSFSHAGSLNADARGLFLHLGNTLMTSPICFVCLSLIAVRIPASRSLAGKRSEEGGRWDIWLIFALVPVENTFQMQF